MGDHDHEKLGDAAKSLRSAQELVEDGDVREQLGSQANDLTELAGREHAPDQERIDGHHHTLNELYGRVNNDDARAHVSRALDNVVSVRDTIGASSGPD